jgi:predicted TIM-barrel fold metal-dependent hydrolase
MMKIDIFSHILPPKYAEAVNKKVKAGTHLVGNAAMTDMDIRMRLMDRYPEMVQIVTLTTPPLETIVSKRDAIGLARMANDEMTEIVAKYPDRFIGAVASLPLSDIDASIDEADRAINQLHMRGILIFTKINGEPLDTPKFKPLYAKMAELDAPIWIHPCDLPMALDDSQELVKRSKDVFIASSIGWPFETTLAMIRLVLSGVFEDHPNIKFITHHCGGMVPFFEQRIRLESLHKFYADTALYGNTPALMCGYSYFGADHLLFGTDSPLGASRFGNYGRALETMRSVERMDIPATDKDKIFEENAKKLLKLLV